MWKGQTKANLLYPIGQYTRRKSGGSDMEIIEYDGRRVTCKWTEKTGEIKRKRFLPHNVFSKSEMFDLN